MNVNTNNSTEVAFSILSLVSSLKIQYGKNTLSRILHGSLSMDLKNRNLDKLEHHGCLSAFSQKQIEDIILQLISKSYLKFLNIGTDFEMVVVGITDTGLDALVKKEHIDLNLPKVYSPDFVNASQVEVVNKEVIDEYYHLKVELAKLLKREEQLKSIIKSAMVDNNIPKIHTEKMDLFCRKVESIFYTKEKVEEFVPEEILEKIRTKRETIVLSAKLRSKEGKV